MGKNGHAKCAEIIDILKSHGLQKETDKVSLERIIRENIGLDDRTVDTYIKALLEFGFLSTKNHVTFKLLK